MPATKFIHRQPLLVKLSSPSKTGLRKNIVIKKTRKESNSRKYGGGPTDIHFNCRRGFGNCRVTPQRRRNFHGSRVRICRRFHRQRDVCRGRQRHRRPGLLVPGMTQCTPPPPFLLLLAAKPSGLRTVGVVVGKSGLSCQSFLGVGSVLLSKNKSFADTFFTLKKNLVNAAGL